jgi:hypothetical protein
MQNKIRPLVGLRSLFFSSRRFTSFFFLLWPSSRLLAFIRDLDLTCDTLRMQKYAFVFLAAVAALLAFVPLVESVAVGKRVTNAQRFARGMTPLPPAKRTKTQGASQIARLRW